MDRFEVIGPAYGPVQEHSTSNSALASLPSTIIPKGAKKTDNSASIILPISQVNFLAQL